MLRRLACTVLFAVLATGLVASQAAGAVGGGPGFAPVNALEFRNLYPLVPISYLENSFYNDTGSYGEFYAQVHLPHRAVINRVVVYFYDRDGIEDVVLHLSRCPLSGAACEAMASILSGGSVDGFRTAETVTITNPQVDLQSYTYMLFVDLYGNMHTNLRVAGVRVDYGYNTSLAVVLKNP